MLQWVKPKKGENMSMADAPSKIRWDKENVRVYTFKLFRKKDQDVIDYLENKNKHDAITSAIREYMKNHPEGSEKK